MSPSRRMSLVLLVGAAAIANGQTSERGPMPREVKPQWQRTLSGDDARKAEELRERIAAALEAGDRRRALKAAEELLALCVRRQGEDHWQVKDLHTLIDTLSRPLTPRQDEQLDRAVELDEKAAGLYAQGRHREAEPLFREALSIHKAILGTDHQATAMNMGNLGLLYRDQGRFGEAEALIGDALRVETRILGDRHPSIAGSLNNLALLRHSQGRDAEAELLYRQALRVHEDALGDRAPELAVTLGNLANLLLAGGRLAEAELLLVKAVRIERPLAEKGEPSPAVTLGDLGHLYGVQHRYAEAEPLLREALRIRRAALGDRHPLTADALTSIGALHIAQDRFADAERLLKEALQAFQKSKDVSPAATVSTRSNLAIAYVELRRDDDAERLYQECLTIRRDALGEQHPLTAVTKSNLAGFRSTRGRHAEAERLLTDALKVFREVRGDGHHETVVTQIALAELGVLRGDLKQAESILATAARGYELSRLVRAQPAERSTDQFGENPYPLRAAVAIRLGKPVAAFEAVEADLARGVLDVLASRRIDPSGGDGDELLRRLAAIERRLTYLAAERTRSPAEDKELETLKNDRRRAEVTLAGRAADLSQRQVADLRQIQAALREDDALVVWLDVATLTGGHREDWACVVRRTSEPKWERLHGTGPNGTWTTADATLTARLRAALRGPGDPAAVADLAAKARAQRVGPVERHLPGVRRLIAVGVGDMAGVPIDLLAPGFLVEQVPSGTFLARSAARKGRADPASLLAVGDPTLPRPVAAADPPLPPGGVLVLDIVPGGSATGTLRPGDAILSYAGKDVADAASLGRAIAAGAREKTVPVKLWRVAEKGEPITRTVDLPPGRLGVTVATDPAPKVLAARHRSERQLTAANHAGRIDPKTGEKRPWTELPGTAVELARLQTLFGGKATILARSDASGQRLDELRRADRLRGFKYLHFATHGQADNDKAFESFLVLAQDRLPKYEGKEGEKVYRGALTARDVLDHWKLDADLVTLSACESGLGLSAGGDGLLGFAQAFLIAGARSVCLTLWEVEDSATALLMDRFYRNLLGKREGLDKPMKKAAALREAKQWLRELTAEEVLKLSADMHEGVTRGKGEPLPPMVEAKSIAPKGDLTVKPYADPRFWAAFILVGDPD